MFNFAFRMTLDRERAGKATEECFLRAYVGAEDLPEDAERAETWLLRICSHILEQQLPRQPEVSFDILDETLRSEATRTDVVRSLTDPQRDFMLWELKQGCMTAVINCLSPGERAAFIMANILHKSDADASKALGISKSAYKVRLSRARKKVVDYLAPRCEHVDPMNPCRCPARVGVAMHKGFIRGPGEVQLRKPVTPFGRYGAGPKNEDVPLRDVSSIYRNLPEPESSPGFVERMQQKIDSGLWDQVLEKKQQRK
ncbi:RNA polymerase sigma factor [Haliangium ochraceum]|uniref:RNA polymerase sigma factor n=1 Tax=Haliangium ochraceum TaxID=80816 RepID=UPI00019B9D4B|nr:RNA polymerase sigma factor [Haliangium ochraceum]